MEKLYEALNDLSVSDMYPFHMPGHKRNRRFASWKLPFDRDITEIDGFDNLHHPEGILLDSQNRLSRLFGTRKSYYSVNGSTGAILAAVSACVQKKGRILMARNCHKSVYHAAALRELEPVYLLPETDPEYVLNGEIKREQVENALEEHPETEAVLITSPSYDGVVSDIRGISETVHRYNIPLIVDEAHGAHFRFSSYFPDSAVDLGADLVVQSFHKTLPALTQTAVLHVCSERVGLPRLEKFLRVFQTSSPSYILMESLDRCVCYLEEEGETVFREFTGLLHKTREKLEPLERVKLITPGNCFDRDLSRLIFSAREFGWSGKELADLLRREYRIETEMVTPEYVLALTSVGDTASGFERLCASVSALDEKLKKNPLRCPGSSEAWPEILPERCIGISEAMEKEGTSFPLEKAEGCISSEFVFLYPPGVPLVVPGERISAELIRRMKYCREKGMELQGMRDYSGNLICVLEDG